MTDPVNHSDDHADHTFEYWAGNPSVEIIHGHIKVSGSRSSESSDTNASNASTLRGLAHRSHRSDSPESCMALASSVPCHMSASELCDFLGAFGADTHRRFRHCRVLHGRNSEEYLIALLMASPQDVEWLIKRFHGKLFNAIEPGACSLHFVVSCQAGPVREDAASPTCPMRWSPVPQHADMKNSPCPSTPPLHFMLPLSSAGPEVSPSPPPPELPELFVGTGAGTQSVVSPTPGSGGDRPFCAVCLETVDSNPAEYQLTELGGGVPLTILCGHTFHARCLSRWCDTTCPVCRFQQHPYQTSSCDVCGQAEGVHICLVCGAIGCTAQQGEGHAQQHFEASSHAYALDVNTQHVWDYAGNGYVHRLLFNDQDGKMVEHTVPTEAGAPAESISARSVFGDLRWADMEDDDCDKIAALFTRALQGGIQQDIEKQCALELQDLEGELKTAKHKADSVQRRLDVVQKDIANIAQRVADMAAEEALAQRQTSQLEALNKRLSQEQRVLHDKQDDVAERKRSGRQQRDREVAALQQEIKDLELFLQMRRRCESSADASELQNAHLLAAPAIY
eukprot:s878_g24.t1